MTDDVLNRLIEPDLAFNDLELEHLRNRPEVIVSLIAIYGEMERTEQSARNSSVVMKSLRDRRAALEHWFEKLTSKGRTQREACSPDEGCKR